MKIVNVRARIKKKICIEDFQKILAGSKTFRLPLDDFHLNPVRQGDVILLKEWNSETKRYTGKTLERTATNSFGMKDIILGIEEKVILLK